MIYLIDIGDKIFIKGRVEPLTVISSKKWSAKALSKNNKEFLIVNDENCNGFCAIPQQKNNRNSFKVVKIEKSCL